MALVSDVVFDVGRVLIDFSYDQFAATLRKQGAVCDGPEGFIEHVNLIGYEHGEISSEEFLRQVNNLLSVPLPVEELTAAWNNLFSPIREMLALEPSSSTAGFICCRIPVSCIGSICRIPSGWIKSVTIGSPRTKWAR